MTTHTAPASPVVHALLERVVDYAGLFPPAALSMPDAVREYAQQRRSPGAWMLGRVVAPVTRLDELAAVASADGRPGQAVWPISALVGADPAGDFQAIRAFNARHAGRFAVESVEFRAATTDAIDFALAPRRDLLEHYVEIAIDEDPRPLLQAIARHVARAKVRTGGVTPDAFPSPSALARFIVACAELGVPFKATAGLHHPLRGEQPLTYERGAAAATMFGFLGVFTAAALARTGADEATVVQVLEERDASAFSFADDALRWRDRTIDAAQVTASRRELALSFGSCSFREPVDDLHRMGIL
ncbi:MAG TPA: hypothetical protein VFY85_01535 [Gemmatimonadaceae bacterium]|nr:hypothetical protein [Gemmatimonadaceae bacterium]